jgi:hypothetical protein
MLERGQLLEIMELPVKHVGLGSLLRHALLTRGNEVLLRCQPIDESTGLDQGGSFQRRKNSAAIWAWVLRRDSREQSWWSRGRATRVGEELGHTISMSALLRYAVGVALGDDCPTERCYGESGELKGLDAERDPNDGYEKKQTADGVRQGEQQAGNDPEDVPHETAGPNARSPDRDPAERPECEARKLEALHRERDRNDWQTEQDANNQPADRRLPANEEEPQDVADGLQRDSPVGLRLETKTVADGSALTQTGGSIRRGTPAGHSFRRTRMGSAYARGEGN